MLKISGETVDRISLEINSSTINRQHNHPQKISLMVSMKKHWQGLTLFADNPEMAMDNNIAPREYLTKIAVAYNVLYYGHMEITKEEFEEIVADKRESLPKVILDKIENVEFFVEEGVSPNLLGLYHGIPYPKRKNPGYSLVMPDKITLFKRPIEQGCRTREQLEKRIAKVLFHEIGHYLGLDEEDLRKMAL